MLRTDDIVRPDVLALTSYPVADATGFVKLDAMENPYPLPPDLRDALAQRLAHVPIHRYPAPSNARLIARLREATGIPSECAVMLGNGSDELINIIATACARPGASLLSLAPSFVMYEMSARLAQLTYVAVDLDAQFRLDLDRTLAAIHARRPAIVYVTYPNNPTGTLYPRPAVEAIVRAAPGLVVIDEAYHAFAPDSFMADLPAHPNMIVMRTLSKSGLAGARFGYMAGHPRWIGEFDKVRPPYNINIFTQTAVEFALEHRSALDAQAAALRDARATLEQALAHIPGVTVWPSAANFLLFRVPDAAAVFERLKSHKVLVKSLTRAHPLLRDCLRVTVSTPEENRLFLDALRASLTP